VTRILIVDDHEAIRRGIPLLSDLGESLKTAQAQLGHARLSTTAEIYTHVVPASQRAAVEKLEKAVWATQLDPNGPKLEGQQSLGSRLIQ
jgi:CheY-like chemotaxis protein